MGRRRKGARVLGPWPRRGEWQLTFHDGRGGRSVATFASKAEAEQAKLEAQIANPFRPTTIGDVSKVYLADLEKRGRKERTISKQETSLRMLFDLTMPIGEAPGALEAAVERRIAAGVAPETVRGDLRVAKTWLRWCVKRQYLTRGLCEAIDDVAVDAPSSAGKAQLTTDESRLYVAAGLAWCAEQPGHAGPVVALLPLLCGITGREVLDRQVRDLDAGGTELIVQRGKTARRRRVPPIPEMLRPWIAACAAGKERDALLFGAHYNSYGQDWVRRVCERAGVPVVSPHGLRGTFASLAKAEGVASDAVAKALGNTEAVERRHYGLRSAEDRARGRAVELKLVRGAG